MNLRSLLYLVDTMGRRHFKVQHGVEPTEYQQIVHSAASVLADWPKKFSRFLEAMLANNEVNEGPVSLARSSLRGLYWSILYGINPTEDADFLRVPVSDFVLSREGRGFRPDVVKRLGIENSRTFITLHEFAKRSGMHQNTAARWRTEEDIPFKTLKWGEHEQKVIDTRDPRVSSKIPGKVYRLTRAAATIGISAKVLRNLKASGDFECSYRVKAIGFHERDIEAFIQKLLHAARPTREVMPRSGVISFKEISNKNFGSVDFKANVIRKMLSGELPAYASVDGTVGGLQVHNERFRRLTYEERATVCAHSAKRSVQRVVRSNAKTPLETAHMLHSSESFVPALVDLGLLEGIKRGKGLWITEQSVTAFRRNYVSFALLAKELGTSSPALMRYCEDQSIPMLVLRVDGRDWRHGFVRVRYLPRVREFTARRAAK